VQIKDGEKGLLGTLPWSHLQWRTLTEKNQAGPVKLVLCR